MVEFALPSPHPSGSKGITRCNTNAQFMQFPAGRDYWDEGDNTPDITTGSVTSVLATAEAVNGCVAGAKPDDCIMILPVVDNSGPGGTGDNAGLAVRMLGAFYIRELKNGQHSGELIENYNIIAESGAYFVPGMTGINVPRLIK